MNVSIPAFIVFLLILGGVYFYLPTAALRRFVFTVCNLTILWILQPDVLTVTVIAGFLLSGYGIALWLKARPNRGIFSGYLIAILAIFLILKKYDFLVWIMPGALLRHTIQIVGLSYMLFRQIHFIVDTMEGQIESPTLAGYLNYQLNFFGILSGPIQRYQEFAESWSHPQPILLDRHDLLKAFIRILIGIIEIGLLAAICLTYYEVWTAWLDAVIAGSKPWSGSKGLLKIACVFYLYPAYVYFNFAGYCDIVIGGASLIGLRLPENFDRPHLARNMIDFWTRWHKTLSFWIRDYLFTPMYKAIAMRWPKSAPSLTFLCYFVALFLAGVWHGATTNFVLFGLLHGLGVSVTKLWENHLIRTRGRKGLSEYLQSPTTRIIASIATFHFVCLTFLFFRQDMSHRVLKTVAGMFPSYLH